MDHQHASDASDGTHRLADAEAACRHIIATRPHDVQAWFDLAHVLMQKRDRLLEAAVACRQALVIRPGYAEAENLLGCILAALGRRVEAQAAYRRALALRPDYSEAWYNLGILLYDADRLPAAEDAYRRALAIRPTLVEARNNLGKVLQALGRRTEAEAAFREALAIRADRADAHYNLGSVLKDLGDVSGAEAAWRQALALRADYHDAQFSLATLLLGTGRFEEGWRLYECRYTHPEFVHAKSRSLLQCPQWQGEPLAGKALLIWQEDGLGDMIQFSRYCAQLHAQGAARIVIACVPTLHRLFAGLDGVDAVLDHDTARAQSSGFDVWTSLLSAPFHLHTTVETIPPPVHLRPDPALCEVWRTRLSSGLSAGVRDDLHSDLRIGLVWKGNARHHNDANRSLPSLATLAPLWTVPGIQFVSLQKGQGEDEAQASPAHQPLLHLGTQVDDLADTAAIVAQLDRVICVDTAVAHLAATLGTPCWVLLPAQDVDWRWMHERTDSPWYPQTLRLFRQAMGEPWSEVVERVRLACVASLSSQV